MGLEEVGMAPSYVDQKLVQVGRTGLDERRLPHRSTQLGLQEVRFRELLVPEKILFL